MLTGLIQPLPRSRSLDRSGEAHALWEHNPKPNVADLPWPKAASFDASSVAALMANAKTVMLGSSRGALYEHVLASLRPAMRAYAYGSHAMEENRALMQAITKVTDRMLVRLGYELPADWLIVDGGRAGVLLVGSPGDEPRWMIPLGSTQARSLFEAFRVLFWFHARREGLPDADGTFALRPPLPAPYRDPGKDVPLPAGRLVIDGQLSDLVPDAEFRIVPDGARLSRASTVVMPPDRGTFDRARSLAAAGVRVVWTNAGLPRTTITRQRLVMDLITPPVAIQLEWDAGTAVDVFHRVNKACEAPEWVFHAQRRLRDIAGPVLLEGASSAATVKADESIPLSDLRAPLAAFETAEPKDFPEPSPLSKNVTYSWRTVPEVVPVGAGKARIVKQWIALDEWASRSVDILRQRLSTMEGEERSFIGRLKGFLSGQTSVQQERARIRGALAEIGEQPPSQRSDAAEVVQRLVDEAGKIRGLLERAHAERQKAEDDAEEREQREAWRARVESAKQDLVEKRTALAEIEGQQQAAEAAARDAEAMLVKRVAELRAARRVGLTEDREHKASELAKAKAELKELDTQHQGKAPKDERKALTSEIARIESVLAVLKRDLEGVEKWNPPSTELTGATGQMKDARDAKEAVRKTRVSLASDVERLERLAREEFVYREGARLPAVTLPDIAVAPTLPAEAPPEIGELFECQGERFLAIRTWEQATRATRVASRLNAKLVAFPDSTK